MTCQSCQYENPAGNLFCGGCGTRLAAECPQCGHSNPAANTFCGRCGQRLTAAGGADEPGAREPESGERRQLTVLFCDLVGSTDLSARLDAEEYGEALRAYHANADEVISRYGGYVAQHLGDGLLVYFGWPQTYDDAGERAVRAGLGLVEATARVRAGGTPLAARVGLHTGTAVVREVGAGRHTETLAVGDTLNIAARVQAASQPGQVFMTAATHRLVAGMFIVEEQGPQPLKGIAQPVELYRVVESNGVRRLQAAAARGFTPFVNRTEERALLRSRVERVCDGEGQVVLLSGEAGIGKSRLAQVVREGLSDTPHTWLETGGSPHFANTPFYAVTELLNQRGPWDDDAPEARATGLADALRRAGIDPEAALPLVAPLLDVTVPDQYRPVVAAPELARKRLLATLAGWLFGMARRQPLVVLVEDLHWVDPSTLDLLQVLVEQIATAPVLLMATARPQFQVPWPPRAHFTHLTLSRLTRRHVRDMVLGVAAQATLLAEVIDEVAARTDGVPLFVEELTKAVVEVGAAAATREIPTTLADSLMARLDRLGTAAKEVAQVGAVCGREFSFRLVAAVHSLGADDLAAALERLVDAELLHARGLAPESTYTFKHALVQDAAYESLLKSRRRQLHGQVAVALTEHFPQLVADHPELIAHHYEAAGQAGPAVAAWQLAGERALERGANRECERYLERGYKLVPQLPEQSQRDWHEFQLQLSLGQVRLHTQGFAAPGADAAFGRAMELGEQLVEPIQLAPLIFGRCAFELTRNGPMVARPLADQLLALAERAGNRSLSATAHLAAGLVQFHLGARTVAREHLIQGLELYDDTQPLPFPVEMGVALRVYLADTDWQLGLVDQARAVMGEALEIAARSPRLADRAWTASIAALLAVYLHDPEQVAVHTRVVLEDCAEEPSPTYQGGATVFEGWSLVARGKPEGRARIQEGIDLLVESGQRLGMALLHCLLAEAYIAEGDAEGALRALEAGADACPDHYGDWPRTAGRRAEILARIGAPASEVEAAFTEALAVCRRYEGRSYELETATSFAAWLRDQGRSGEARKMLQPVYDSFSEGFDTRDFVDARAVLATLAAGEPVAEAIAERAARSA